MIFTLFLGSWRVVLLTSTGQIIFTSFYEIFSENRDGGSVLLFTLRG